MSGFLLFGTSAEAAAAPPDLLVEQPQVAGDEGPSKAIEGKSRIVRLNNEAFTSDTMRLALSDDMVVTLERDVRPDLDPSTLTWHGTVVGEPNSEATFVIRFGTAAGQIWVDGRTFELRPLGGDEYTFFEYQAAAQPAESVPFDFSNDLIGVEPSVDPSPPTAAEQGDVPIDLLVVYTAAARPNGVASIEAQIALSVQKANDAYANSGLDHEVTTVAMVETSYVENGDLGDSLQRVRVKEDGFMDEVHALRDAYGADIVGLITNDAGCGKGYVLNNPAAQAAFEQLAFFTVTTNCLGSLTLAHELGHVQGLAHAKDQVGRVPGIYEYSAGYRVCGSFSTVMAYTCGAPRVGTFSSPQLTVNGLPAGIAFEADPVNSADSVRSLNDTAPFVTAWRASVADPVPAAPSSLTATAASSSAINLTWADNSSNETGFRIERSLNGSTWAAIGTVGANQTSFTNNGLTASTAYAYRVSAFNSGGSSPTSNTASATTQPEVVPAPTSPNAVTATATSSSTINVTWNDRSSNETGFRIERSLNGSSWILVSIVGANQTSFTNNGLAASTTYIYRVRAYNNAGNSTASNSASATTQAPVILAPTAPNGLTATAISSSTISLTWSDRSANETGFRIQRSVNGSTWTVIGSVGANQTSFTNGGLAASTTYIYRVYAYNTGGNSSPSATASATTQPSPRPATPDSLTAIAVNGSTINVSWADRSSNETGFRIQRSINGSTWTVVGNTGANQTSFTSTGLAPDTTYIYRVYAYNANGISGFSATASATTLPLPTQSPFVSVTVPGSIEAENFDNGGQGVAYFDTDSANRGGQYRSTGVDIWNTPNEDNYTVGGTRNGEWTEYTFDVTTTGSYLISGRVNTGHPTPGSITAAIDGTVIGQISPASTGWWNWQELTFNNSTTLQAGTHVLRLTWGSGAQINLDRIDIATPGPTQSPFVSMSVPGSIEAENFDNGGQGVAYFDTDSANRGGQYRSTGVDIWNTPNEDNYTVGGTRNGEWLEYTFTATTSGDYTFRPRVNTGFASPGSITAAVDGAVIGQVDPTSAGWWNWQTPAFGTTTLEPGTHILRLTWGGNAQINIDRIDVALSTPPEQTPFASVTLPGRIEAENFDNGGQGVAFFDTDPTVNRGGQYRSTGVDIWSTPNENDFTVGATRDGEWLEYTFTVPETQTYTIRPRVNTGHPTPGTITAAIDGTVIGQVAPPSNGWWSWQNPTFGTTTIEAGTHVLRLTWGGGAQINIDHIQFSTGL